ncbi:MAG: OmpH family outer membrane protein [Tannerella sp.]|jgi:outer membrane protein|nr:OmpH family outer membrane protein [Tannerella sp.]
MKNVSYVINGVLGIAVIVLFILHFTGNKHAALPSKTTVSFSGESTSVMPIAYIKVDSLLWNYSFAREMSDQITKKGEDMRAILTQEARKFQTDYESFQYRLQNQAFATQQRAEQEQQRLQRQQQTLAELEEKLTREWNDYSMELNLQLRDTIIAHMTEFNKTKKFHLIFSNSSSDVVSPIIIADDVYDITNEVIDFLNKKSLLNK